MRIFYGNAINIQALMTEYHCIFPFGIGIGIGIGIGFLC
jgi:hypothetical protein